MINATSRGVQVVSATTSYPFSQLKAVIGKVWRPWLLAGQRNQFSLGWNDYAARSCQAFSSRGRRGRGDLCGDVGVSGVDRVGLLRQLWFVTVLVFAQVRREAVVVGRLPRSVPALDSRHPLPGGQVPGQDPVRAKSHGSPPQHRNRRTPHGRAHRHPRGHPMGRTLHGPALHHPRTHINDLGTAVGTRTRPARNPSSQRRRRPPSRSPTISAR
jgi:hypothetical protein